MKAVLMGHLMSLAPVIDWISDLGKIIMRAANPRGSTEVLYELDAASKIPLHLHDCALPHSD